MKKRKAYKASKSIVSKVSEPVTPYGKEDIRIFNSFEEMEKADAIHMASLTPVQHLRHVTAYIIQAYAKELSKPMKDLTIHFKSTKNGDSAS